jgi:hypothetical protein
MLPEMMRQTAEHFSLAFWSLASISSRAASSSLARLGSPERSLHARLLQVRLSLEDVL